jgi:epoxyqueuosine reductase
MKNPAANNTRIIKQLSLDMGFSFCGISVAEFLTDEAKHLDNWLRGGLHGQMKYMENHFDKRLDPTLLVPGAKSVISLLYNYFPSQTKSQNQDLKISKYALGEDYHDVIRGKLYELLSSIRQEIGDIEGRVFVDSAPVLERAWAAKSGLGWIGKNAMLINKEMGSFFFIAEIISDLELLPDGPIKDYCGTCTACIDACPTDAIIDNKVIDSNRCISYLTIELRDAIPTEFNGKMGSWVFGCDICQDVCPWNRFSKPHKENQFNKNPKMYGLTIAEWQNMTEEFFKKVFGKSALRRTGLKGMKRNVLFLQNKEGQY